MKHVARKHNLYEQVRFKTEVIRIEWVKDDQMWKVQTRSLETPIQEKITTEYYNYV